MKTTIEIPDELHARLKQRVAELKSRTDLTGTPSINRLMVLAIWTYLDTPKQQA